MTPELYRSWLLPAHRVLSQAILASYRKPCQRRTHHKRSPQQKALFA